MWKHTLKKPFLELVDDSWLKTTKRCRSLDDVAVMEDDRDFAGHIYRVQEEFNNLVNAQRIRIAGIFQPDTSWWMTLQHSG